MPRPTPYVERSAKPQEGRQDSAALADRCETTDTARTDRLERKQGNIRYLSIDVVDKEMRGHAIKARDTKEPNDASR